MTTEPRDTQEPLYIVVRRKLKEGASVSEIAQELGFYDASHLRRTLARRHWSISRQYMLVRLPEKREAV